jgi:uncharacterized protein
MNISKKGKTELEGIVHAEGTGGRIIVFRVKPGFDIIEGIKKVCKYYDIKAGVISSIFGSLEKVTLMVPMEGLSFPVVKNHDPNVIEIKNLNVASGCGLVNTLENGEITIHLHIVAVILAEGLSGFSKYPATGGHVADYAPAPCLGTIEIAIEEAKGLKLIRKVDSDVGLPVTFPVKE